MIKDVPFTGVFANDQEAALEFYTDKLGLQKVQDEPYGKGARWITVSPQGARIRIVLKNIVWWNEYDRGGHYTAHQTLDLLVGGAC